MKNKLIDIFGYIAFLLLFILLIPILVISGAILRPIRYYKYVSANVHDKKAKEYWYWWI